jgi:hypothetical protein
MLLFHLLHALYVYILFHKTDIKSTVLGLIDLIDSNPIGVDHTNYYDRHMQNKEHSSDIFNFAVF